MMALLQNVKAAIHHEQQQALDLHFDGLDNSRTCNERCSEQRRPAAEKNQALIPTVGDGLHLKHTRDELISVDQHRLMID